jgi:hypothetical protein
MCKLTLRPDGYQSPDNISARFHPSSYVRPTAASRAAKSTACGLALERVLSSFEVFASLPPNHRGSFRELAPGGEPALRLWHR